MGNSDLEQAFLTMLKSVLIKVPIQWHLVKYDISF